MRSIILLTLILGVYSAPSDYLDSNDAKLSSYGNLNGEASSFNSEVLSADSLELKFTCSAFDKNLERNCTSEADMYLETEKKSCCRSIAMNNCKMRYLESACSPAEYQQKRDSLKGINNFHWGDNNDCPKNYGISYCEISIADASTSFPPNWVFTGALVFLITILLLAIIFGIKFC